MCVQSDIAVSQGGIQQQAWTDRRADEQDERIYKTDGQDGRTGRTPGDITVARLLFRRTDGRTHVERLLPSDVLLCRRKRSVCASESESPASAKSRETSIS